MISIVVIGNSSPQMNALDKHLLVLCFFYIISPKVCYGNYSRVGV
jgi:hypothetical protein